MRKKISSIVTSITIASIFLNHIQSIPVLQNAEAASFRTTYTVFGDLNDDKVIDSFDVILMRSKVADGNNDKKLDFNCDDKVDSDDLTLLSDYVLGKNCIFDAYLCEDADEDHICDMLEVAYLKTDPDSKDSDGDTLTDYDEIVYTNTSPTDKYTRKLTVTDADDDADGDKLTNKEELSLDTSPLLADSDEDEISDYEEINKYNTDPNDDDSDDDNITDGDEIKLGLKPDSDKSNGITYDYERTFNNKIPASSELLSYINVEESPYEVSIDIKSAGNVDKALSVHIGDFSNISEDERVIGRSVSFSYDEKLSVDSAKIYFKPYDINESIENYMLFQFFPETNYLLPVETKYTKDSAYVETSELGTFCLVDVKDILDSKENTSKATSNGVQILAADIKVSPDDIVWDYTLDETEVLFYIDISNCATDTVESTKQSILDFSEALFEHCDNAAIQIIGYDLSQSKLPRRVYFTNSKEDRILVDLNSVKEAIEKIATDTQVSDNNLDQALYDLYNNNTGIIQKGLFSPGCKNRYVFITYDSPLSLTQNFTGYWYNGVPKDTKAILEEMYTEGIHVNTLFSDNLLKNSRAVKGIKYFKDACDEYDFGVYTKSSTGYFGNTGYARVYSDAITDIQSLSVMYTCSVSPNAIPSSVERNAFINSLPPSYDKSKVPAADSDGNVNFKDATVKVGAATLDKNGNLVFKNLYNACDESDLTRNGYEQLTENMEISRKLVWDSFQITPFSDKILYADDDDDGIPNKWDANPNESINPDFILIDCIDDYSIDKLICDESKNKLEKRKTEHRSLESDWNDEFGNYAIMWIMAIGGATELSTTVQSLQLEFGSTPHSVRALSKYLTCSGNDYYVNLSIPIGLVENQRTSYYEQLNLLFDMVEQGIKPGRTFSFATTKNPGPAWHTDFYGPSAYSQQAREDWYGTYGGADNALLSEVYCSKEKDNKLHYYAKINYYTYDVYDWDRNKGEAKADKLNLIGKAKSFRVIGEYSVNIEWIEGSRYPLDITQEIPLSKVEFEGINDNSALKNAYNYGIKFYDNVNFGWGWMIK